MTGSKVMSGFIVNRHGRIVFPQNFFPRLDFGVFAGLEDFEAVIKRDFDGEVPDSRRSRRPCHIRTLPVAL